MLPANTLVQMALCLSTFGRLVSASPSYPRERLHVIRQDDGGDDDGDASASSRPVISFNPDSEQTSGSESGSASRTSAQPSRTTGNLNTVEPETGSASRTRSSDSNSRTTFPPDAPAGGVSIKEPKTLPGSTALFKIGDTVNLAWNYTDLRGPPDNIDVLISCSAAAETWTLTSNMSFATQASYLWNTSDQGDDGERPLLTELYTLIIKDSEAEISDRPEPGYLGAYDGFTFGLYARQPYTDLPDFECIGCNAASPSLNTQALGLALTMSLISVLSFTWFVTGWGLQ